MVLQMIWRNWLTIPKQIYKCEIKSWNTIWLKCKLEWCIGCILCASRDTIHDKGLPMGTLGFLFLGISLAEGLHICNSNWTRAGGRGLSGLYSATTSRTPPGWHHSRLEALCAVYVRGVGCSQGLMTEAEWCGIWPLTQQWDSLTSSCWKPPEIRKESCSVFNTINATIRSEVCKIQARTFFDLRIISNSPKATVSWHSPSYNKSTKFWLQGKNLTINPRQRTSVLL